MSGTPSFSDLSGQMEALLSEATTLEQEVNQHSGTLNRQMEAVRSYLRDFARPVSLNIEDWEGSTRRAARGVLTNFNLLSGIQKQNITGILNDVTQSYRSIAGS